MILGLISKVKLASLQETCKIITKFPRQNSVPPTTSANMHYHTVHASTAIDSHWISNTMRVVQQCIEAFICVCIAVKLQVFYGSIMSSKNFLERLLES